MCLPAPDTGEVRGTQQSSPLQLRAQAYARRGPMAAPVRKGAETGPRRGGGYRVPEECEDKRRQGRLWPGLLQLQSMSLASFRPGTRNGASSPTRQGADQAHTAGSPQLVRALALHGVIPHTGSHLASPLRSGRGVLTLGVSRRRGVSGLCP
jgi:hypothetical protein